MANANALNGCGVPNSKKYLVETLSATGIYVLVVIGSVLWLKLGHPSAPWKYLIAAAPVLPAMLIPATVVRCFRAMDEFQQKVQLEGLAFGFTGSAVLTLAFGFLEGAGMPRISWTWVWPVMSVCWVIGLLVARARYK